VEWVRSSLTLGSSHTMEKETGLLLSARFLSLCWDFRFLSLYWIFIYSITWVTGGVPVMFLQILMPPEEAIMSIRHCFYLFIFVFAYWSLNSWPCVCQAGTLPLEPLQQPCFFCLCWVFSR
jgi:hypothetical protein